MFLIVYLGFENVALEDILLLVFLFNDCNPMCTNQIQIKLQIT